MSLTVNPMGGKREFYTTDNGAMGTYSIYDYIVSVKDMTITVILSADDVTYSQTGAVLYCAENLAEFVHSITLNVRSKY